MKTTRQAGAWRSREPQPLTNRSRRGAAVRSRLLTQAHAGAIRSHDLASVEAKGKLTHARICLTTAAGSTPVRR